MDFLISLFSGDRSYKQWREHICAYIFSLTCLTFFLMINSYKRNCWNQKNKRWVVDGSVWLNAEQCRQDPWEPVAGEISRAVSPPFSNDSSLLQIGPDSRPPACTQADELQHNRRTFFYWSHWQCFNRQHNPLHPQDGDSRIQWPDHRGQSIVRTTHLLRSKRILPGALRDKGSSGVLVCANISSVLAISYLVSPYLLIADNSN